MKIPAIIYLTDSGRPNYLMAADDKARIDACVIYFGETDMSAYWSKIGTAEVDVTWDAPGNIRDEELRIVDVKIETLQAQTRQELNRLREYRSTLLCLEAPK